MTKDEYFMTRALQLAVRAKGRTSPNPMVGAVLVRGDRVIAGAFHCRAGGDHAERKALKKAGSRARGATLYVSLEPCCHFGKTPPCTDLIIAKKISRVVVAMADPNPLVDGRGLERLRASGIQTHCGLYGDWAAGRGGGAYRTAPGGELRVAFPQQDDVFRIDPGLPRADQAIRLRAAVPAGCRELRWVLDGRPLAAAAEPRWRLEPGTHTVYVRARRQGRKLRSQSVRFLVQS